MMSIVPTTSKSKQSNLNTRYSGFLLFISNCLYIVNNILYLYHSLTNYLLFYLLFFSFSFLYHFVLVVILSYLPVPLTTISFLNLFYFVHHMSFWLFLYVIKLFLFILLLRYLHNIYIFTSGKSIIFLIVN